MIQRIQTLLLAAAMLVNTATLFLPLWQFSKGNESEVITGMHVKANNGDIQVGAPFSFIDEAYQGRWVHILFFGMTIAASALLAVVIFLYGDRVKQMKWAYAGIVLILLEILALVLLTLRGPYIIPGGNEQAVVQFGFAMPVIAVLLVWFAAKRIKADEDLVRSVDRIR
jgi:hypothetical protein